MKRLFFALTLSLLCLIAYSQTTLAEDLQMFNEHKTIIYSTAGDPRAGDIALTVEYPETWKMKNSNDSGMNIVKLFLSREKDGRTKMCMIVIGDVLPELKNKTDKEIASVMLTDEFLLNHLKDHLQVYNLGTSEKDGELEQIAYVRRQAGGMTQYIVAKRFIYKGRLVEISVIYGGKDELFLSWDWDHGEGDFFNLGMDVIISVTIENKAGGTF